MGRGSRFNEAYKREAVAKAEASGNVTQTARELGISGKTLHSWLNQYGQPKTVNIDEANATELARRVRELEKALRIRDKQIDVLKKAISIVSESERNDT